MSHKSTAKTLEEREELFHHAHVYHLQQLTLCDQLEAIADSLPLHVNAQQCLITSLSIFKVIKEAHQFEEDQIFPMIIEENGYQHIMKEKLKRLKFEHWEDQGLAEDISDALWQYVSDPKPEMCEILSYMLSGFFGSLRRHIAFEAEFILPQLKSVQV